MTPPAQDRLTRALRACGIETLVDLIVVLCLLGAATGFLLAARHAVRVPDDVKDPSASLSTLLFILFVVLFWR